MESRKAAQITVILFLSFIFAVLVSNLITSAPESNLSQVVAGIYHEPSQRVQTQTSTVSTSCGCYYDDGYRANRCSNSCGDLSGAFCYTDKDCII